MRESNYELRSEEFMNEAIAAHQGAVYRLALSQTRSTADAQDVMQDVFIKLMRSQVPFRDGDHLRAWLLRVTSAAILQGRRGIDVSWSWKSPIWARLLCKTRRLNC